MKPIRIFIPTDNILDAYIYYGHIFAVFDDGTLRALPLTKIFDKSIDTYPELTSILKLALLRNDWLLNSQAMTYFHSPQVLSEIKELWQKATLKDLTLLNQPNDWQVMWQVPSLPIYDLRLYAMRVYLGHRNGIHEGIMQTNKYEIKPQNGLAKIFDSRTIGISARSGELMFSADDEGLFHGSLWEGDSKTKVFEKSFANKSLRTGWRGFDVLNYKRNSYFEYIKNETEKMAQRPYFYSSMDESPEKVRISKMAVNNYPMDVVLHEQGFATEDIQFCFNNSKTSFFFLQNGHVIATNWAHKSQEEARLSSKPHELSQDSPEYLGRPCSAISFAKGIIIKYFDKVVFLHHNQFSIIETEPVISVRTFPSSIQFKRLICITREDGLALHAIFPTDKEISSEISKEIKSTKIKKQLICQK